MRQSISRRSPPADVEAAAYYIVSLAVGQYNRRNASAMEETLKADSQVVRKLFEELSTDAEHADKTKHPKIFIGRIASQAWGQALPPSRWMSSAVSSSGSDVRPIWVSLKS